ncbi:MAG TPA: hypothetical protein VLA84_16815 [Microcoleus sp.]|nr:hypothetical protein [Microcoleus sp.]
MRQIKSVCFGLLCHNLRKSTRFNTSEKRLDSDINEMSILDRPLICQKLRSPITAESDVRASYPDRL